ncbi:MAG: class I SAM-dependent methyltransferase [Anaerolineae bacterium]
MPDSSSSDERVGWELIWRSADIPPRYRSLAAPNATVVEWAETLPQGGFVLDIGCGVGRHCVYLGGRGLRMAGMDISPTGIKTTEAVCAEHQIDFEGRVADMTALPWETDTFDGALSISTLHHHLRADIVRALAEVLRVLKPGGLFLVDFPSTDTIDYQELRRQITDGEITEPETNTFVDIRPGLDDMNDAFLPHHFCDEADLRDLLRSFEIIRLWAALRDVPNGAGKAGKWVAWVRKPQPNRA